MIGKLEREPLRAVWKNEAYDFTPWLQENLDVLGDAIDLTLVNAEREQSAGDFSVDLVAEDDDGDAVVIECQLGKSNHDHLGKLVTYLSSIEAKTGVWVASEPRPEHVKAIGWLNESSAASFYLVKVQAVKIGTSEPAPLFTLIVGPSEESREAGETKKDIAERYIIRKRFWTGLLEHAKQKTSLHTNISPGQYSWVGTSTGKRGINYNYVIRRHEGHVEIYIDRGQDSDAENKRIFDQLYAHKDEIENVFGSTLTWQKLESKRACRIGKTIKVGGYRDSDERWQEVYEEMVDAMSRLEQAMKPFIAKLKL